MIIPVDFAQINYRFSGPVAPRGAQVVFGCQVVDFVGGPSALGVEAISAWADTWRTRQSENLILTDVLVKYGPNATGLEAVTPSGNTGTVADPTVSPQVAMLVTKVTGEGGRHGKGRSFLPGFNETNIDGAGVWSSGELTACNTAMSDFLDAMAAANAPLVLLHSDATTPFGIDQLLCNPLAATQRRRIRKVGGRRTVAP